MYIFNVGHINLTNRKCDGCNGYKKPIYVALKNFAELNP